MVYRGDGYAVIAQQPISFNGWCKKVIGVLALLIGACLGVVAATFLGLVNVLHFFMVVIYLTFAMGFPWLFLEFLEAFRGPSPTLLDEINGDVSRR